MDCYGEWPNVIVDDLRFVRSPSRLYPSLRLPVRGIGGDRMILFLSRPYDSWPAPDVYDTVFENNEWAAIIEACQNNAVPDTWLADGSCSKAMTIGGTTYTIDVIGKQHDQYADGGTAPLTFQLRQIPVSLQMNPSATVSGGW